MSVWRDIWRKSVSANRIMAENEEDGLFQFAKLFKDYNDDGMIHYVLGESWEYCRNKEKALEEYRKAMERFPVVHWKKVAENTILRLKRNQSAEQFYNKDNFEEFLWLIFQKVYEFVHLDDFSRYISLSAISRGSSEWPLSLVDFRTVTELEIRHCFPEIVEYVKENYSDSSLYNYLKELNKNNDFYKIPREVFAAMHKIRIAGNLATHEMKFYESGEDDKFTNINSFLKILEYFNDKSNSVSDQCF